MKALECFHIFKGGAELKSTPEFQKTECVRKSQQAPAKIAHLEKDQQKGEKKIQQSCFMEVPSSLHGFGVFGLLAQAHTPPNLLIEQAPVAVYCALLKTGLGMQNQNKKGDYVI